MAQGTTKGVPIDIDPTLAADSDLLVPSQKAIKTYVDTANSTKQDNIILTTTGKSGAATLVGSTLNVPQYSSIYAKSVTPSTTTTATGTQILASVLIPANTLVAGDVLRVTARLRKTGTAAAGNFAIGINTSISPSGAFTFKTNSIGTAIPSYGIFAHGVIVNATTNTQLAWPATNYGTNDIIAVPAATGGSWVESTVNWTVTQYIIFQVSLQSPTLDSASLIFYMIEKL